MTREDFEIALFRLQDQILNHFDPSRVEEYTRQLELLRNELRAMEEIRASSSTASAENKQAAAGIRY